MNYPEGYVVGSVIGDGHIRYMGRNNNTPEVSLEVTDKNFANKFKENLKQITPKRINEYKRTKHNKFGKYEFDVKTIIVNVHDAKIFKLVKKFKENFKLIENKSLDTVKGFLQGLFDAEGSLIMNSCRDKRYPWVVFYNKNVELLQTVKKLLSGFNIHSFIRFPKNRVSFLKICRKNDVLYFLQILPFSKMSIWSNDIQRFFCLTPKEKQTNLKKVKNI